MKNSNIACRKNRWVTAIDTVKVLIISRKCSLLDATTFKPVILAWMPESSTKDGNCMIINNIILRTVSHPCDWIPASMLE
jgi:hypothetical protein